MILYRSDLIFLYDRVGYFSKSIPTQLMDSTAAMCLLILSISLGTHPSLLPTHGNVNQKSPQASN